ncbi:hypothetical protein [Halopiger xanaduensis]|uniref:hypothetical protein n=1 Tax=Halopiger xanaduensis TaxID=387343 RepID=UPI001FE04BEB|nr:hypothetical protein [Halopiger xanaduensis]
MTVDALLSVAPEYDGPPVANYGTGTIDGEVVTFEWNGGAWPAWFVANRLGFSLAGIGLVLVATLPYDRYDTGDESTSSTLVDRLGRFVPSPLSRGRDGDETDATEPANVSLTPVADRSAGGFGRLFVQELRLLIRGRPWWWYAGAAVIAVVGVAGTVPSAAIVSVATIWPLFVWSGMGYRSVHHRVTPFIVSSRQPYRQLFAEWSAGALVTGAFLGVAVWPTVLDAGLKGAIVLGGAVLFVPSVAQVLGLWSRTRRAFELGYLVLWYAGPLNGVPPLDFAGATTETVGTVIPVAFGAVGLVALGTALGHRWLQT